MVAIERGESTCSDAMKEGRKSESSTSLQKRGESEAVARKSRKESGAVRGRGKKSREHSDTMRRERKEAGARKRREESGKEEQRATRNE